MTIDLQTAEQEVTEIYVSTFGRAPDQAGLAYWVGELMKGNLNIEQVSQSFFDQEETQALYGEAGDVDFLISVYKNTLGQTVDANDEGLKYWLAELEADGGVTRDGFIKTIINGAKADTGNPLDAQLLENRVNAGLQYAKEVGVESDLASQIMNDITSDAATAENALGTIDFYKGWVDDYSIALGPDATLKEDDLWKNINDKDFWSNLENDHTLTFDAPPPVNFWEQADGFWAEGPTPDENFAFLQDENAWREPDKFNNFKAGGFADIDASKIFANHSDKASTMYHDLINSEDMNADVMQNMFGNMDETLYKGVFDDMFAGVDEGYFKDVYSENGVLKEDSFNDINPNMFNQMFSDTLTDDTKFQEFFGDFNPDFVADIYIDKDGHPIGELPEGFKPDVFPEGFVDGFEKGEFSEEFVAGHFPNGFDGSIPPPDGTFPADGEFKPDDGTFPADGTLPPPDGEFDHPEGEFPDDGTLPPPDGEFKPDDGTLPPPDGEFKPDDGTVAPPPADGTAAPLPTDPVAPPPDDGTVASPPADGTAAPLPTEPVAPPPTDPVVVPAPAYNEIDFFIA